MAEQRNEQDSGDHVQIQMLEKCFHKVPRYSVCVMTYE
ncbi:Hypothetical protein Bdt_1508 [Bdellovibrio bacteriovorus str. Tiberius]|uniref:Uncharacterized protein n=1 Tax=Bdellovibrio bacteriovorus str. Tiberius TaxID=1069642 RepID=K7Z9G9_BDEBC|nr:Hypothetical protein Bdt_1508 [Bdellovibrio bacteriovorus str. Tiberius]